MPDQANDFLKDYQAFAQQSWDTWMRYLQQPPGVSAPFGFAPPPAPPADDFLTRSLASLQAYGSWLQQAAGAGATGQFGNYWQQPAAVQPFLAAFNQPFAQTVAGLDSASAFGLDQQWRSWLQAMQRSGLGGMGGMAAPAPMAAFGITREMQLDQQSIAAAMHEYAQINGRYQTLLQQVNAQGIERLQEMLKEHSEPGKQIESLKGLYDMWVDAMEDAYAKMALSDEYREVFGALVNAQMQVRKLQQQQTEQICRELGIPTRSELDSLGQRVQQLRRDVQGQRQQATAAHASEVDALRAEIAALKRELAASASPKPAPVRSIKSDDNGKHSTAAPRAKAAGSASAKRK
ncbi:MAG TPA: poly(R)-hydroxyalkanoic acid synthase subunit PhaE [Dyella sp.]|uniref:poly(R)-hydroxyalkanoic acid synthase subunit PhaE n=1 Tax=Dyella sp. TaxID=1869338 RepID=UPI002C52D175|nr:poly(R)-hydroxyalkanoic acid synthase subunit PhaE [Dyella sp.]HTV86525.1 poly(R)-hydroxyalkanoic acid synthase subunit PhaE [Dyella sp.]